MEIKAARKLAWRRHVNKKEIFLNIIEERLSGKPFTPSLLKLMFASIGVSTSNSQYKRFYITLLLLFNSVPVTLGQLFLVFDTRELTFIEKIDVAIFFATTITVTSFICLAHFKEKCFIEIYNSLTTSHFVSDTFYFECDEILKSEIRGIGLTMIACVFMNTIYPFVICICTETKYGSLSTLVYPSKFPWFANTLKKYLATFLLQCAIVSPALLIIIGIILFSIVPRIIADVFLRGLAEKINNLDSIYRTPNRGVHICCNAEEWETLTFKRKFISQQFNDVMEYHRFFNKFVLNIINSVEPLVVIGIMQFMVATIGVASLVVLVDGNLLYRMKMINVLIISDVFFFLCCYMGEWLNDLNDRILNILYGIRWYEHSMEFKRNTVIFMQLLRVRPYRLKGMSKVINLTINLMLYSKAFKYAYSAIQIILKSHEKYSVTKS